ncbi:hypothetical protein [Stutzerimonas kunmingensis]|uniref:hypothetical protein n=1 Tax=Stutzerimonas kunmingensis TaxID=1211807 RepID=UPI001F3579C0|nr:hypothetical protein [Stutzerimonas kunmingensis]UIP32234.1 hypothetical protein LW136_19270 [Stutzerimonas kunmingensis]
MLERLLCPPLSAPLSQKQYGSLRIALNTLVEALASATVKGRGALKTTLPPLIAMERSRTNGPGSTGSREHWYINPADEALIWNAIVLQGLFGVPKIAVLLIRERSERLAYVDWARQLFLDRQSVAGLGLLRQELITLLDRLIEADLNQEKLPNPFADAWPQMGLGPHKGNLLKTLASQTAALSVGDSMMAHYFNGELTQAYDKACGVVTDNALLLKYRDLIITEYQDAREFDELLDFLR